MVDKISAVTLNSFISSASATNNEKFQNSIMDGNTSSANIENNPLYVMSMSICQTVGTIDKQGGPAVSFAQSIGDKATIIMKTYMRKIIDLNSELEALKGNPKLSKEDLDKKVKEIQTKIDALQKEGEAKMKVLQILVSKMPRLNVVMKTMSDKGIPSNKITEFLTQILNNISSSPSDFKADDDTQKIDEKIKKGTLGADSDSKLDDEKQKIQARIDELNSKLKTETQPEEKEKINTEKEALSLELETVEEIKSAFKE